MEAQPRMEVEPQNTQETQVLSGQHTSSRYLSHDPQATLKVEEVEELLQLEVTAEEEVVLLY